MEAALDAIGVLPPKPAPVEAKTEGESLVVGHRYSAQLAQAIDQLLIARDAAHQTALEELRERCANVTWGHIAETIRKVTLPHEVK
jgi:hypothetical protein